MSGKSGKGAWSPLTIVRVVLHLTGLMVLGYGTYSNFVLEFPSYKTYNDFAGKLKYLTQINAVCWNGIWPGQQSLTSRSLPFQILQSVYYTICLLNDLFGTNEVLPRKQLPAIRRLKDYMFAALAMPVALNVGGTFWSLMAIDRELVFPKAFDSFFPKWVG